MLRRRLAGFNTAALLSTGACIAAFGPGNTPPALVILLVASLVFVAELGVVRLAVLNQRWTISLVEAVVAASLLHYPGLWVVAPGALGMAAAQLARQTGGVKALTNTTMYIACFTAAGSAAQLLHTTRLGNPLVVAGVGAGAFWFTNLVLLSLVVGWVSKAGTRAVAKENLAVSSAHFAINITIGLVAGSVVSVAPWWVLGSFAIPVVAAYACYDMLTRKVEEVRMLSTVVAGQQNVRGRSIEDTAQAVMGAFGTLLGTTQVEMVVLDGETPRRYSVIDGTPTLTHSGPGAAEVSWLPRLLSTDEVAHGRTATESWLRLRIGALPGAVIALRAEVPIAKTNSIGRREVRMAKLLCRNAENWLPTQLVRTHDPGCPAGQVELRQDAGALRDAAARLVTIAEAATDPSPAEVLRELHRVERAVAVMLGTLSADPSTALEDHDVPWVSSGTLPAPRPGDGDAR